MGLLPFRHPLVTVIGKPIQVPQLDNPTEEQGTRVAFLIELVSKYHELYVNALTRLYEEYKPKYAPDDTTSSIELAE